MKMEITISRNQLTLASFILMSLLLYMFEVNALQPIPSPIVGFSISPTNPHYATIRENGAVEVIDYQTSAVIGSYSIPLPFQDLTNLDPTGFNIGAIAYSPDGNQIAISISDISFSGIIYLLDWQTGLIRQDLGQVNLNRIVDMSWSPDGSSLAVASIDGGADQILFSDIAIVNVTSGEIQQRLADMISIEGQALSVVAWSSLDIIAYANDTTLVFWDANANTALESAITSSRTLNAIWSPNGQYIATLHSDRTLQIWDGSSDLSAPQQTISIMGNEFLSRDMRWLDDNLLAVNVWTEIQIWNVTRVSLEEVIEADHFIVGLGSLTNNEIAFADPQSVSTYSLADLRTPTPVHAIATMPTASPTSTQTFTAMATFRPKPQCIWHPYCTPICAICS